MANHGYGKLNDPMTKHDLYQLLNLCNIERFDGILKFISNDDGSIAVILQDQSVLLCWMESPMEMEWRHEGGGQLYWWLEAYLTSWVVNEIGGVITDDGHGEVLHPDYHVRYPSYRDWVKKYTSHMSVPFKVLKRIIDLDRCGLSKEYWKIVTRK